MTMTTSVVLTDAATQTRVAIAGFLAGYCGATRRSCATDLRIGDGARVVFNATVRSANYHPANYNRFGDALRTHGCTAPSAHVEEGPRRLDKRAGIKAPDAGIKNVRAVLTSAAKMMEQKCCHFDWCIGRTGIVTTDKSSGADDIVDGMHPGCAPYRKWLDGALPLLG